MSTLNYKPLISKYKVLIIDEVHMLSKSAFNALLKILEEPPLYVIFIFATTELHKIPDTIISRCQKFQLASFSTYYAEELLRKVCEKEGVVYDEKSINLIAQNAKGSARDALSILDQAISLSMSSDSPEIKLNFDKIAFIFSNLTSTFVINFISHVLSSNKTDALNVVKELIRTNANIKFFMFELLELLSYISKLLVNFDDENSKWHYYKAEILNIVSNVTLVKITQIWQLTLELYNNNKSSELDQNILSMLVINMLILKDLPTTKEELIKFKEHNVKFIQDEIPRQ
jgi:DNA polymerase-3 subunit gamma/tau